MRIDKGIPLPRTEIAAETARRMRVGDSVFFKNRKAAFSFANTLHQVTTGTPYRQAMYQIKGGWRVWKVKRPSSKAGETR